MRASKSQMLALMRPTEASEIAIADSTMALVEARRLVKHFSIWRGLIPRITGAIRAVDRVNLAIYPGEAVGLVGESGCGKTTVGRCLLGLVRPTDGTVRFCGRDLAELSAGELRRLRRHMQIVFQDPVGSLNPRRTVYQTLSEPIRLHGSRRSRQELRDAVVVLLGQVGLDPDSINRYPHAFSGGQRQRIGIARALASRPRFIVCDEPVSALDVSVQAQVLNLLEELRAELGLAYLLIAHDLAVVRQVCDRVAVMYLGRIVEIGPTQAVFEEPSHPYTRALLAAVPRSHPRQPRVTPRLRADVPSPAHPPSGCRFRTRCAHAVDVCTDVDPELTAVSSGHRAACARLDEPDLR